MLHAWKEFVEKVDPDVVIGYNIAGFDFPYLMDRAKALKASKFPYLGRMKCKDAQGDLPTRFSPYFFSSQP